MQKDFEAQKIKLKSFIDENIAVSFDEHFCIHELIDTLQPPKPPTCATCEHFTQELSNTGYCHKGIGQDYIRFTDGVTPFVFMDFSCNKHSDYGDEK